MNRPGRPLRLKFETFSINTCVQQLLDLVKIDVGGEEAGDCG
jgi:hypothetical protein